jgi:hypothetical protein
LHARHATVVITAEGAVLARPAALLKTLISEALLGCAADRLTPAFPAAKVAPGRAAAEPVGYRAIGIRHAEPVRRIMRPGGTAQAVSSETVTETVTIEERVVEENTSTEPVGGPSP